MMFEDEGDFHASVFILGPDAQTVLIRETRRPQPLWKFPGGKKKQRKDILQARRGEKPAEAAARELFEETGLTIKAADLIHLDTWDMGHFNKHFFVGRKDSLRKLRPLSDEYEEAKRFPIGDVAALPDMHRDYQSFFVREVLPYLRENIPGKW